MKKRGASAGVWAIVVGIALALVAAGSLIAFSLMAGLASDEALGPRPVRPAEAGGALPALTIPEPSKGAKRRAARPTEPRSSEPAAALAVAEPAETPREPVLVALGVEGTDGARSFDGSLSASSRRQPRAARPTARGSVTGKVAAPPGREKAAGALPPGRAKKTPARVPPGHAKKASGKSPPGHARASGGTPPSHAKKASGKSPPGHARASGGTPPSHAKKASGKTPPGHARASGGTPPSHANGPPGHANGPPGHANGPPGGKGKKAK